MLGETRDFAAVEIVKLYNGYAGRVMRPNNVVVLLPGGVRNQARHRSPELGETLVLLMSDQLLPPALVFLDVRNGDVENADTDTCESIQHRKSFGGGCLSCRVVLRHAPPVFLFRDISG